MKHVKHFLSVVVPVATASAIALAASPAWTDFVEHHTATASYILAAAGAARAAWKAFTGSSSDTYAA